MATQIIVEKNQNENSRNVLRRFVKRVRTANFTRAVKDKRYYSRKDSRLRRKQSALMRLEKSKHYERLYKLGKITVQ